MEDTSTTTRISTTHRVSPAYSAKIYKQLVRRLTEDLNHGLANTCNDFNLEDKCVIHFLLEAGNYSYTSARAAAIIARREKKKQRTKARNEKIKADRIAAREEYRRKKAEQEKNEGWGAVSLPEGMFIQFFPKKGDASPTYKGISVKFPDGTNLTLQECSADGLESLINIYKKRKEAAVCLD